jgi:hypothetical protein
MSFCNSIVTQKSGIFAVSDLYKANSNIGLVITRRLNGNVVVYEVMLNSERHITSISMFWMDQDSKYKQKSRNKGKNNDREEFSVLDKYAYGIKVTYKSPQQWEFIFNRFAHKKFYFSVHSTGVSCFCDKDNIITKVHHLYIHDQPKLGILWPSVDYIDIVGFNQKTKQKITERVQV